MAKERDGTIFNKEKHAIYSHLFTTQENKDLPTIQETTKDYNQGPMLETPQRNMRQGIKMFGDAGVHAMRSEMQQLHDRKVMKAMDPKELTRKQKKEALAYLMLLKRKRS